MPINPQTGQAYPQGPNGLAVASMICGIVGIVGCCCCPLRVASIVAIVLGHIALSQIKAGSGQEGSGMAKAGLILGYVTIGITILMLIAALVLPQFAQEMDKMQQQIKDSVGQHK